MISTTKGTTTADGFASIASTNAAVASACHQSLLLCAKWIYASTATSASNPLSTSFNPETHATGSTCTGCSAKTSAPSSAAQALPINRRKMPKTTTALATCSS